MPRIRSSPCGSVEEFVVLAQLHAVDQVQVDQATQPRLVGQGVLVHRHGVGDLGHRVGHGLRGDVGLVSPSVHRDRGGAAGRDLGGALGHDVGGVREAGHPHAVQDVRGGGLRGEQVADTAGAQRPGHDVQLLRRPEAEHRGGAGGAGEDVLGAELVDVVAFDGNDLIEGAAEAALGERLEFVAVEEPLAEALGVAGAELGGERGVPGRVGLGRGGVEERLDVGGAFEVGDQVLDLGGVGEGLAEGRGLLGGDGDAAVVLDGEGAADGVEFGGLGAQGAVELLEPGLVHGSHEVTLLGFAGPPRAGRGEGVPRRAPGQHRRATAIGTP